MQLVSIDSDVFLYPQDEQTATVIKRFKANYNDKAVFEAVLLRTSKPQPSKDACLVESFLGSKGYETRTFCSSPTTNFTDELHLHSPSRATCL